tara:strand:+ start:24874 stop:25056 length:183 start_codon:yes stop_codon:yes gene_type:complete
MGTDMDKMAVEVARRMLAVNGVYCEIVVPPKVIAPHTFQFIKRCPVTRQTFRVTFTEEAM